MPKTAKGIKIYNALQKQYGEKKGASVFFAMENSGKIKGVAKRK